MAITQVLQGCGAWSVDWAKPLPMSMQREIQDGASLVVFESRPEVTETRGYGTGRVTTMDNALDTALFMGPMTAIGSSGCSGWEMSWWWQQPNGVGPEYDSGFAAVDDWAADFAEAWQVSTGSTLIPRAPIPVSTSGFGVRPASATQAPALATLCLVLRQGRSLTTVSVTSTTGLASIRQPTRCCQAGQRLRS